MVEQRARISKLTSGERLRRKGRAKVTTRKAKGTSIQNLIVMGASAGGHEALIEIFSELPANIPAAIIIILHAAMDSPYRLKDLLERFTRIPIIQVEDSEPLRHGAIFVPPPGESATLSDRMIVVDRQARPERRPATTVNRLFASAARTYGKSLIGVILSGTLRDGTDGLRAVHEAGGITVVQDPADAKYPSMPTNAMENLPVTFCLNLSDIGPALELLIRRGTQFETGLAVAVRTLQTRAALLVRLVKQSWRNPGTHDFLEKELLSLNRDIHSIETLTNETLHEI